MPQPLLFALIAAFTSIAVSLLSAIMSARTLRLEREKMDVNRARLDAEVAKLAIETQKLADEMNGVARAQKAFDDARIDLERKKLQTIGETRTAIYPQLAEIIYRIRNQVREINEATEIAVHNRTVSRWDDLLRAFIFACKGGGPDTYIKGVSQLTDDLYKYRLFIDPETWTKLHRFKRLAQNLVALLDKTLREPETDVEHPLHLGFRHVLFERLNALAEPLARTYREMDVLHGEINAGVKKHFGAVLERIDLDEDASRQSLPRISPDFDGLYDQFVSRPRFASVEYPVESEKVTMATHEVDHSDAPESSNFWPAVE